MIKIERGDVHPKTNKKLKNEGQQLNQHRKINMGKTIKRDNIHQLLKTKETKNIHQNGTKTKINMNTVNTPCR